MNILVKGMDMPTACRHGECNFACSAAYQTGLICIVRKQYVVPGDVPGDCPCFLVPPHGRLIDADALEDNNITYYALPVLKNVTDAAIREAELVIRLKDLDAAPTIIPAEEDKT